MLLRVDGRAVYAYSGARELVPAQPTVVFVHGAANDHSVWSLQSRYFAWHGHNVIAVDLPGHGRSEGAPLASVRAMADWLAEVAAAAGVARYALCGHSMGALACLEHAAHHGDAVTRLALVGAAVPMAVSDALLDAAQRNDPAAFAMITAWSHSPAGQLGGNRAPGLWMSGQTLRLLERTARDVLHVDLRACRDYADGLVAAAAVRCPALVMVGERDLMAPPRAAVALQAALHDARHVVIEGAGHAMMAEQPDAVLDALRGFVAARP